ncbi:MAG: VWA domain-containing protein [Deltaproteobacteria bacterium]|nr:VWA domain-containing protein [Deltaproteobacteria bacterium]
MRTHLAIAGGLVVLACAAFELPLEPAEFFGPPAPEAQVAVEILPGFTQLPEAPRPSAERVEILLDLTTSMREATPGGPARFVAAREAAVRLLEALPEETALGLRALGVANGAPCVEPTQIAEAGGSESSRSRLVSYLRAIQPASEGSLGAALEALQRDLGDEVARSRVVLFTDLGAECGGDLCVAGSTLVAAGAQLDLVLLSDAVLPECFARFAPADPPRAAAAVTPPPEPSYRVEAHAPESEHEGKLLARGSADGSPIQVPAGAAVVTLEMDPPSIIGPMLLSPDALTRVRVLDFPTLDPHVREWRWDVEPAVPESTSPSSAGARAPQPEPPAE